MSELDTPTDEPLSEQSLSPQSSALVTSLSPQSSVLVTSLSPPRPRKSLGQHFLKDKSVPPRIADAANIEPGDLIIEVGPGLGVLTEELAGRLDPALGGRLVAVELDSSLLPILQERFADRPHVSFVHADILNIPPADLSGGRPYKLVANLPYYITSAILRHFLEAKEKPQSLTVMVQREVAERMAAKPPDMSLLAVAVQFYGKPKIIFRVPPGAFKPPPKVDSAVVHIEVYPPGHAPVQPTSEAHFFHVAHAGFGQKRKQLVNTLSTGFTLPKATITTMLREIEIDPTRRAETLSLEEWSRIESALAVVSGQKSVVRSQWSEVSQPQSDHIPQSSIRIPHSDNPKSKIQNPKSYKAYAKINLSLEIIGKRADSYHDIISVIQMVDLADALHFAPSDQLTLACDNAQLASEGDGNLVLRAARLLQQAGGIRDGAHIELQKGIPMSAGLGGGSSDAATTLLGLSDLWGLRPANEDLHSMAAQLGSDVPFFLEGPTALVEGRGERITHIPSPPPCWVVLVCSTYNLKDKTKRLYSSLTPSDMSDGALTQQLIAALTTHQFPQSRLLFNAFDRPASLVFNGLDSLRHIITQASGRDTHLSGSGPTLYTLYPAHEQAAAQTLHDTLSAAGLQVFLTRTRETMTRET